MKTSSVTLLLFSLIGITAACCGAKSSTSCCGKGKCNIFCCNCNGGCKTYEDCCRVTCGHGCIKGGEMPPICAQLCRKRCVERSRELGQPEDNFFAAEDRDTDEAWLAMSDDEMFAAVKSDDDQHFTYAEFLKQRVWEDSEDAREFFDRFDVNKDGVITIDEMREPDEGGVPDQRPDQRPVLTGEASTVTRDEL